MARATKDKRRASAAARTRASRESVKSKPSELARAAANRNKVREHRKRLRANGMRPITIWVPDMRSPRLAAEARRQCKLANKSVHATDDQAWVEAMSDWSLA